MGILHQPIQLNLLAFLHVGLNYQGFVILRKLSVDIDTNKNVKLLN